jgi:hypothetical protein
MKSDAAAYIQLVTTGAVTNSGFSVITPCTHSDFAIQVSVGAFGPRIWPEGRRQGKDDFRDQAPANRPAQRANL